MRPILMAPRCRSDPDAILMQGVGVAGENLILVYPRRPEARVIWRVRCLPPHIRWIVVSSLGGAFGG